ncbi:AP2-like ethylene-responsive transcription factor TOE3 [Auxenochlorella protothecoides]|uniref:AP2-like ethylene-responsive transcription factor TOE3 n=1 Tax=Auxenochlorella protothecoides TaxID=3075 RepID=A0A087SSP1_AUXPR|nr:AP2-like ethylene-responsive transcription factor TOE3 [Auxenochlorella protothecoides]KFM28745.1 AP2-like ethylene-responsive transcription factor TOE3 [Auxenochlorella protothecoides]
MAYPAGPWFDPGVFGLPAAVPTQSSVRSASPSHTHSGGTPSFSGSMGAAFGTNPHEAYGGQPGPAGSRYRGVSYDRKKAKWRVQIKVAALGKSGVSVGYYDTEEAAARAYDRAAIGLLGRDSHSLQTNYGLGDYAGESIPRLAGKSREEVKTTLKSERIKAAPRRRFTSRQRTSRFMGVGSSNRKNQWQARILVHGKVTHLGYYETEAEAARVYDRVSIALHGDAAQTNFPAAEYPRDELRAFGGLEREDLQRALGVKPMDKSSRYRGVSKKKGRWEAKVMVNRRWAYRELFDSEEEAARAYDSALWRLKPKEARSYVNFKDEASARAGGGGHAGGGEGAGASDASDADPDLSSGEEDEASDAGSEFSGSELGLGFSLAATGARPRSRRVGSAPNLARWAMSQQAAGGAGAGAWPPGGWATGGGAAGPPLARSFSGTPSENAPVDEEGARALSDPLLDRFGSGVGGAVGGAPRRPPAAATLGKRDAPGARALPRTASEPHFPSVKLEEGWTPAPVLGEVAELLYDDDFFALAFEGGGGATPGTGPARGGGSGPAAAALTFDMDFETAGLLDFIKDMPDAGAGPSLGKSRSAVDLSSWDPASADGSGGAKLGPLGHPIRRINTFATKLPTFEEVEERAAEGGYASDHLTPRKNGNQGEDDLVAQLMEPSTSQMEHDYSMDLLT